MIEDLTPEERSQLEQLNQNNPDTAPQVERYSFGPEIEQSILAAMLADRLFMVQAIELVKSEYFPHQARELICETSINYFKKYNEIPTRDVMRYEILEKSKNKNKPQFFFEGELNTIYDEFEPNLAIREYLLDQIEDFAKIQAFKLAYRRTIDLVFTKDESKWEKMAEILKQPFIISRQRELGLDYFQTLDERFARMRESRDEEVFTTGFDALDVQMARRGFGRGEIIAWMGSSGSGKSILLVQTAIANVLKNKNVLFLSLEMDQDKVARRFDSQLANTDIHDLNIADITSNVQMHKKTINTLKEYIDKRLIIKQFPAGTADVMTFRSYTSQLYQTTGFKPDLVIVDYVGEMKDYPNMKSWESKQRLCRDLRAWGIEEKLGLVTALQPNRGGKQQQENDGIMDDSFLADSFGQIRVLDALWSINQSKAEKSSRLARLSNLKMRDGQSGVQVYLKQDVNPLTLKFEQIEHEDYKKELAKYRETKLADVEIDGNKKRFKPNKSLNEVGE